VREFGRTVAELANKSVLVIDIDSSQPAQHSHFGLDPLRSIERIIKEGGALDVPTERFGPPGLYLGCFSPHPQAMTQMNDYWDSHDIGRLLKNRFDLILIDSAPVSQNGEGLVLCRKVDGVVLVVEADKSRSPIVRHVRDKILQSGGNLLGIVFNKQQYYIPEWLYSKL